MSTEIDGSKYTLPSYQPKKKVDRSDGDIYPFTKLGFDLAEVRDKFSDLTEPLSLFAQQSEEEDFSHGVELDRPVTPIDEQIKSTPGKFSGLATLIRRRLVARSDIEHLNVDDQQSLSAVIMGEVNGIWPDFRQQVADPFMSVEENKELQRRITVHIVTVCEQLFHHYIAKALILKKRGVFSGPANMSRLKAQLSLDANKFLNILTIRRHISTDMRTHGMAGSPRAIIKDSVTPKSAIPILPHSPLSYKGLVDVSRPKSRFKEKSYNTIEEDLEEIRNNIPGLDIDKVVNFVSDFPIERSAYSRLSDYDNLPRKSKKKKKDLVKTRKTSEEFSREKIFLKKSDSLPKLFEGDLLEELGMVDPGRRSVESLNGLNEDDNVTSRAKHTKDPDNILKPKIEKKGPGTREYVAEDLANLLGKKTTNDTDEKATEEDDLPPLIQAITRAAKHDNKGELLKQKLKHLEEVEQKHREAERLKLQEPKYPQPATVTSKLPNKMMVRTSDIRVSERVCLSTVTLDKFPTVYNDLIDEIDADTIKELDSNLFLGQEITDVYKEIMKTVPTDHLSMDNDDLIEPTANKVNLTAAMASSTLSKPYTERVINPTLHKATEPPWGDEDPKEWTKGDYNYIPSENCPCGCNQPCDRIPSLLKHLIVGLSHMIIDPDNARASHYIFRTKLKMGNIESTKIPAFTPYKRKTYSSFKLPSFLSLLRPLTVPDEFKIKGMLDDAIPEVEQAQPYDQTKAETKANVPSHMQDFMARSYASWLAWWKNTINGDDYIKYLSTQETDFMGVVYHFYNSEDEEEDEDGRASKATKLSVKQQQQEERERKILQLKEEKEEYKEGVWNVKTILMGGLGKDPELPDEDTALTKNETESEQTFTTKTPRSKARIVSRKSNQMSESMQDMDASGMRTAHGSEFRASTVVSKRTQGARVEENETAYQDRLEKVWSMLELPDSYKLDMAIKYSSDQYHSLILEAITQWEKATDLVLQRESLIAKLEKFERSASDPNRFFEKGNRGSSVARLEEAKIRSNIYKRIDLVDRSLKDLLEKIQERFQDCISYQGRPYLEKMKWDRTEMLFWLQEERKQQAFEIERQLHSGFCGKNINLVQLDPLMPIVK